MGYGSEAFLLVGVIIGFIVMVLLGSLPVLGPIIGGFIAGLIARGGPWGGATAGLTSGLVAAIILSVLKIIGGGLPFGTPEFIPALSIVFYIVAITLYFCLIGFIGGGIAGAVVK